MKYLSLLEKLKLLSNELMNNWITSISLIIIFVLTVMLIIKKLDIKKYIISMILLFIGTLITSIILNYNALSKTFDNFMTNFLAGIYFPSIYVYISMFIFTLISFIISIIKTKKVYKVINSIAFIINNILLIVILNIIAVNNIDVFSMSSLYTNNTLVAVLELNMGLSVVWVFALITAFVTNTICDKLVLKKNTVVVTENNIDNINSIVIENDIIEEPVIESTNDELTFNDILNGLVPVTYYDSNIDNNIYNISNPQELYENKYNEVRDNNIEIIENTEDIKPEVVTPIEDIKEENVLSVEDYTSKIKEEKVKNNLENDTISLNDLIKQDKEIEIDNKIIDTINNDTYTLEDYKKITKMLKEIKNNSSSNNITLDDALTISLINNYSVDECIKFKEILESNFN